MSMNRRVTLAMLGLAPTAAIGAESFVDGPVDAIYTGTSTYNERVWANAFRNLAGIVAVAGVLSAYAEVGIFVPAGS